MTVSYHLMSPKENNLLSIINVLCTMESPYSKQVFQLEKQNVLTSMLHCRDYPLNYFTVNFKCNHNGATLVKYILLWAICNTVGIIVYKL